MIVGYFCPSDWPYMVGTQLALGAGIPVAASCRCSRNTVGLLLATQNLHCECRGWGIGVHATD
jgi:hypothetical protein